MGRAEEAGEPPRPDSPPIQQGKTGGGGPRRAERPLTLAPIGDDDVEALEASLTEDDLDAGQTIEEVARARRRLADQVLVAELEEAGWDGPVMQVLEAELAAYGIAVMMAWTRTGEIVVQCKSKGRPIFLSDYGPTRWEKEDRLELAMETVATALRYFIDDVLAAGRWDAGRGASLRTFFVGACLLNFPNVYNAWFSAQDRWGRVADTSSTPEDAERDRSAAEVCWQDPTSEKALRRTLRRHALESIKDPDTRHAAEMIMNGVPIKDAAANIGLSPKALENRLYRIRRSAETRRRS